MFWTGRLASGTIVMPFRMRLLEPRNNNGIWVDGYNSISTFTKFRGALDSLLHRKPKPLKLMPMSQLSISSAGLFMTIMLLCFGITNFHLW